MKAKNILTGLICLFFTFSSLIAQEKNPEKIVWGEWYYRISNDTIILEKASTNQKEYKKWVFKESNVFYIETKSHGKYDFIGRSQGDTWSFDHANHQIIIVSKKARHYQIISMNNAVIRLKEIPIKK